jgi:hypothetical protein
VHKGGKNKMNFTKLTKRFGVVAACAVILGAAALGLTACGGNTDDGGKKNNTGEYHQVNFESIAGGDIAYKFNGHWYGSDEGLQEAVKDVLGEGMENAVTVISVGGNYYTSDELTQYVKYNGNYYSGRTYVYRIGDDYFESDINTAYRTGNEGNYSYSDTSTENATSVYKVIKLDGTPVYFESYPDRAGYYRLSEDVFVLDDVFYNLENVFKVGANTQYYTVGDMYNGTIRQGYRIGEENNYTYHIVDMGLKFGGEYYTFGQIEFYYKVK